ncbi:hypothetical protein HanXRQr2_Chr10g0462801 [Helianthus annuus]|uniref:Uncharacterized protein n=1 Tax=Helianthus annuus TaxID=4232 RepID=A0A9K3I1K5_HELAN|nr:hypothetical protein HanXRQr2_Chr10g0462801 [Helianthus annuus]
MKFLLFLSSSFDLMVFALEILRKLLVKKGASENGRVGECVDV